MKSLKNILYLIIAFAATFYMAATFAIGLQVPELSVLFFVVLIALSFIPKSKENVAYDIVSPDVSAIAKYAVSNKVKLLRRYYNGMKIANDITLQPNVKNALPMPMLVINGEPRPYTGNFMPNAGDIAYTDRELVVNDWQRDLAIDTAQYRNTYLAQYRGPGEGAKNTTIPFAQFTMETFIDRNSTSLNNKTAWNGLGKAAFTTYNAGSTYAVNDKIKYTKSDGEAHYYICAVITTAGQNPETHPAKWTLADALAITEGLGTKIKAARTSSLITNVASTGTITATDAYKQAIAVYRKLPAEVRDNAPDIYLYGSTDMVDLIADSYENDIKKFTDADGKLIVLPRTDGRCKIIRASWMAGSGMFMASPKSNLYMGTDLLSDMNEMNMVPDVFKLKVGMKGVIGFQFADEQAIAVNDQN